MSHKFPDFNESLTWLLYAGGDDAKELRAIILNDPDMYNPNYMGWAQDFSIDPDTVQAGPDGLAEIRAYMRQIETGYMSDMRAPLGDSLPIERGNLASYSAPIGHFTTHHFHETKSTMLHKREMWEQLRDSFSEADADSIMAYKENLRPLINEVNMTLTYMCEQLMTRGYVYYDKGSGIQQGIYKAEIPAANFLNASVFKYVNGVKTQTTWDDLDAALVDSLRELVDTVNTNNGVDWDWQLDVPKAIWDNYIMKNKQVLELVRWRQNVNGVALPSVVYVTDEMVRAMLAEQTGLPQIVVHDTKQKDINQGFVRGWASGIVTLRPVGKAGLIRHSTILDTKWFNDEMSNPLIRDSYTPALNGLGYLNSTVYIDGRDTQYRTRFIYSATPTLDEFLYHYIINTAQASS